MTFCVGEREGEGNDRKQKVIAIQSKTKKNKVCDFPPSLTQLAGHFFSYSLSNVAQFLQSRILSGSIRSIMGGGEMSMVWEEESPDEKTLRSELCFLPSLMLLWSA